MRVKLVVTRETGGLGLDDVDVVSLSSAARPWMMSIAPIV